MPYSQARVFGANTMRNRAQETLLVWANISGFEVRRKRFFSSLKARARTVKTTRTIVHAHDRILHLT